MTLSAPKRYTIYDLPEMLELQKMFLCRALSPSDFDRIRFCNALELPENENFDLVFSTYAYSELEFSVAEKYLETIVKNSKMGFMTYNNLGSKFHVRTMKVSEFTERLTASSSRKVKVEIHADEFYQLGGGGDPTSCNVVWKM